jgi:hypothetical protein
MLSRLLLNAAVEESNADVAAAADADDTVAAASTVDARRLRYLLRLTTEIPTGASSSWSGLSHCSRRASIGGPQPNPKILRFRQPTPAWRDDAILVMIAHPLGFATLVGAIAVVAIASAVGTWNWGSDSGAPRRTAYAGGEHGYLCASSDDQ